MVVFDAAFIGRFTLRLKETIENNTRLKWLDNEPLHYHSRIGGMMAFDLNKEYEESIVDDKRFDELSNRFASGLEMTNHDGDVYNGIHITITQCIPDKNRDLHIPIVWVEIRLDYRLFCLKEEGIETTLSPPMKDIMPYKRKADLIHHSKIAEPYKRIADTKKVGLVHHSKIDADYLNQMRIDDYLTMASNEMQRNHDKRGIIISVRDIDHDILPYLKDIWEKKKLECIVAPHPTQPTYYLIKIQWQMKPNDGLPVL